MTCGLLWLRGQVLPPDFSTFPFCLTVKEQSKLCPEASDSYEEFRHQWDLQLSHLEGMKYWSVFIKIMFASY